MRAAIDRVVVVGGGLAGGTAAFALREAGFEGAVTLVRQTGKPIAEVARDLGVGAGTLGNWVHKDRMANGDGPERTRVDAAYVRRLERELAEVRMERDVLKRSVVLWVKEAMK